MGRTVHPVPDPEEGAPAPPPNQLHPRLYVCREAKSLVVSVLPREGRGKTLALSMFYYSSMLLLGLILLSIILALSKPSWPPIVLAVLWILGAIFLLLGSTGVCCAPCRVGECCHDVIEICPESICIRRAINGWDLSSVTIPRAGVTGAQLDTTPRGPYPCRSLIVEGERRHVLCKQLPEHAQRRLLTLVSEFLEIQVLTGSEQQSVAGGDVEDGAG